MAITTRVHIMELDMLFWILICYAHKIHMYEIVDDIIWYEILYTSFEICVKDTIKSIISISFRVELQTQMIILVIIQIKGKS